MISTERERGEVSSIFSPICLNNLTDSVSAVGLKVFKKYIPRTGIRS